MVEIDCENGIVVTQDGTKYQGDAVIGADGVHSVARLKIAPSIAPFDSGKNAFRFMMSRTALESDPLTAGYAKGDGELSVFYGRDRRVIMYPTNNNEEFNFGAFHPSTETNATGDDWTNQTTVEAMLEVFRSFHPSVQAILQRRTLAPSRYGICWIWTSCLPLSTNG